MTANGKAIEITPDTRIGELLDNYPELEAVLIKMAPGFARLSNPVLRKTVARVATIKQAAAMGGIPVPRMINELRRAAGFQAVAVPTEGAAEPSSRKPSWYRPECVVETMDARPMLEAGEAPISAVLKELRQLAPGQCLELITPFRPAPLVDVARKQGFEAWSVEREQLYRTYFTPKGSQ
ncbi:MAG: DUF1858 domain-containing protein [Acidobacteriota bacterium]